MEGEDAAGGASMQAEDIPVRDRRATAPGEAAGGAPPSSVPWTTAIAITSRAGATGPAVVAAGSVPGP
jgi:hypothetical protein